MNTSVVIRNITPSDIPVVLSLVNCVVEEVYGHLLPHPLPLDDSSVWMPARVATVQHDIAGVSLVRDDLLDDLWLGQLYRQQGIGSALLADAEQQIASSGHTVARLRVVEENEAALHFYQARGWKSRRRYPHEKWSFNMVDMEKRL